jgi:hypothetical protein
MDTSLRAYGFYRHRDWRDWKTADGLRWMELQLQENHSRGGGCIKS